MKWLIGLMFICVTTGAPKGKAFSLFRFALHHLPILIYCCYIYYVYLIDFFIHDSSVVSFKNEECTTTMDPAMNGLCVSSDDCSETKGTASGNCASGFGVCCFHK